MDGQSFSSILLSSSESAAVYKNFSQMAPHVISQEDSVYGVDKNIRVLIFPIIFSQSHSVQILHNEFL